AALGQKGLSSSGTITASPETASRPARTESARSAPPSMNWPTSRPWSAAAALSCCPWPITTTVSRTAEWPSIASTAQRSTGLPPISRYCFGMPPPRRSPFPAATMSAVTVTAGASRAACLVRQGLFHYLPPTHERAEAHFDRSGEDRRAGDPGADDGCHRPAVPADRQALRRGPDGQRDDRQPGDGARNPPVAAEGDVGPRRGAGLDAARRLRAARDG